MKQVAAMNTKIGIRNSSMIALHEFLKTTLSEVKEKEVLTLDIALSNLPDQANIRSCVNDMMMETVKATIHKKETPESAYALCALCLSGAACVVSCLLNENNG